jgi:hypothetical protein
LVERGRKLIPFDISSAIEAEFYSVDTFFQKKNIKLTTKRETPIISMVMRDTFDFLIVEKAVENGAKLLGIMINHADQGQLRINVKLNTTTVKPILATLERQSIVVEHVFMAEDHDENDSKAFDVVFKFFDI